jgi:hypothetical protein
MHIVYSVFLDILSGVFVGVSPSLQARFERVSGNIQRIPFSEN